MSSPKPIQLGLCCINMTLRKNRPSIFCNRTMRESSVLDDTNYTELFKKINQNLDDLLTLIEWNEQHGIRVYRMSSDMFPHFSNPNVPSYTLGPFREQLERAGKLALKYGHRITFHPGQYNVIGTPREEVFEKTLIELKCHADILDMMGMGPDSVMVIHGGGVYSNKSETIKRWYNNFQRLPENVRRRLVLECCEKSYSITDCLEMSKTLDIPVIFDTHHFECYRTLHPKETFREPEYYIPLVLETFKRRNIKPKFHVSEQGEGRIGHHSDYIETIPNYLLEIPEKYGVNIDIMIEAKHKELAIFRLYEKYPFLNCKD